MDKRPGETLNMVYHQAMDLVLDIASSAEFWRKRYPLDRAPLPQSLAAPRECASTKREVLSLLPDWVDHSILDSTGGVLHVLDTNATHGRATKQLHVHKWNGPIPENSFFRLNDGVYIESPGFMFLQAAHVLDFASLIAFGDELCGCYSFDEREERGFRRREKSLTSCGQLESYLKQAAGCRGQKLALRALSHMVDGSASPMETFDEMTMCLPYRYGGYGVLKPQMNVRIDLSSRAARIAKRAVCYLDMGYIAFMLDIEHHGKHDHSSLENIASDRARVNALKEMGIEVIELTADQVGDVFAYEYIIQRVCRILGKRLSKDALGATLSRLALRKRVFDWNRSSGMIRS